MKVSEYASDVNLSVAEILKKCHELAINVNNKDDYLTDDDIIMLDNTINLISTDDEITFEEEEDIEDKVDEIMTSSRVDKSMKDSVSKEKLKKKDTSKQDFNLKKKEMYKHKNKLMKNETDENIAKFWYDKDMKNVRKKPLLTMIGIKEEDELDKYSKEMDLSSIKESVDKLKTLNSDKKFVCDISPEEEETLEKNTLQKIAMKKGEEKGIAK